MKTQIQIQQENVNNLIKLMKENPTLEVIPMVNSDVVVDDGYSYWKGSFGKSEIDECWSCDSRIYFKSDEEELVNDVIDDLVMNNSSVEYMTDEELEDIAKKIVDKYAWEKVITININTP